MIQTYNNYYFQKNKLYYQFIQLESYIYFHQFICFRYSLRDIILFILFQFLFSNFIVTKLIFTTFFSYF